MNPFLTLLTLAAIVPVGMALALSQFCMVRAVLGVREGVYAPARCVLAISLAIAVSLQLLALLPELPIGAGGGLARAVQGGAQGRASAWTDDTIGLQPGPALEIPGRQGKLRVVRCRDRASQKAQLGQLPLLFESQRRRWG